MHELALQHWIDFSHALAIGLFVGLEREHTKRRSEAEAGSEGAPAMPMGVRTFTLFSLLGWALAVLGEDLPWLPPTGFLLVGGLVIGQYLLAGEQDRGLTTEVAALMTFVMGLMVIDHHAIAVALAIATTLLLLSKRWMTQTVTKIRRVELTGALQLLILLAVVLPLLPAEAVDPWGALPPRKIGLFVVLIAGLGFVGYVLMRVFGGRRGVGLTGLLGGLTSSTAVTVSMAKAGREEHMRRPGQMATFIANATMFFRVIVITAVINPVVALRVALPMTAMGLVMLGAALWWWRGLSDERGDEMARGTEVENPFALIPALMWGLALSAVLLVAALAAEYFGDAGVYAAALFSGLADVDAITLAVTEQSARGALDPAVAATATTIAAMSNTVVKAGMAWLGGGTAYGRVVAAVFAASLLTGGVVAALL